MDNNEADDKIKAPWSVYSYHPMSRSRQWWFQTTSLRSLLQQELPTIKRILSIFSPLARNHQVPVNDVVEDGKPDEMCWVYHAGLQHIGCWSGWQGKDGLYSYVCSSSALRGSWRICVQVGCFINLGTWGWGDHIGCLITIEDPGVVNNHFVPFGINEADGLIWEQVIVDCACSWWLQHTTPWVNSRLHWWEENELDVELIPEPGQLL